MARRVLRTLGFGVEGCPLAVVAAIELSLAVGGESGGSVLMFAMLLSSSSTKSSSSDA